jgi:hypothetical protein
METAEADIITSFNANKDDYISVADFNLANERLYGTRPVILHKGNTYSNKITDVAVKVSLNKLMENEHILNISSLNDQNYKYADFKFNYKNGVYEQGILYQPDASIIEKNKSKYNYITEYKPLIDGWYYYIYYYNQIKNADVYRKAAWNHLDAKTQKSISINWKEALVTLQDWSKVGIKLDKNAQYDFVVSVTFNTNMDALLGPLVTFLDPKTSRIVGYSGRD